MILADLQDLLPEMATQVGQMMLLRIVKYLHRQAQDEIRGDGWQERIDAASLVNTVLWNYSLWEL